MGAQARELKQGSSSEGAHVRELKQGSSCEGAQARELKRGSSIDGAQVRELKRGSSSITELSNSAKTSSRRPVKRSPCRPFTRLWHTPGEGPGPSAAIGEKNHGIILYIQRNNLIGDANFSRYLTIL